MHVRTHKALVLRFRAMTQTRSKIHRKMCLLRCRKGVSVHSLRRLCQFCADSVARQSRRIISDCIHLMVARRGDVLQVKRPFHGINWILPYLPCAPLKCR